MAQNGHGCCIQVLFGSKVLTKRKVRISNMIVTVVCGLAIDCSVWLVTEMMSAYCTNTLGGRTVSPSIIISLLTSCAHYHPNIFSKERLYKLLLVEQLLN